MRTNSKARSAIAKPIPFSQELKDWLDTGSDHTLGGLSILSSEKSFAILFLLLMGLPALPIPTAGITHVTELIAMLLSLELIVGRRTVWLPKRWSKLNAGKLLRGKAGRRLISFIAWFERHSQPRYAEKLSSRPGLSLIGVIVLVLAAAAFVAPPFSGLDTLPSLGVVVISLSLILEDALLLLFGLVIGVGGIGLELAAGTAIYEGFKHLI